MAVEVMESDRMLLNLPRIFSTSLEALETLPWFLQEIKTRQGLFCYSPGILQPLTSQIRPGYPIRVTESGAVSCGSIHSPRSTYLAFEVEYTLLLSNIEGP